MYRKPVKTFCQTGGLLVRLSRFINEFGAI